MHWTCEIVKFPLLSGNCNWNSNYQWFPYSYSSLSKLNWFLFFYSHLGWRHPPFYSISIATPIEQVHQLHPIPCNDNAFYILVPFYCQAIVIGTATKNDSHHHILQNQKQIHSIVSFDSQLNGETSTISFQINCYSNWASPSITSYFT